MLMYGLAGTVYTEVYLCYKQEIMLTVVESTSKTHSVVLTL